MDKKSILMPTWFVVYLAFTVYWIFIAFILLEVWYG